MESPVSVSIEGDKELGLSYLPEARQMLFRLRERMKPGGVDTSRDYMEFPDGSYAYAISAMGIDAIRIVTTRSNDATETERQEEFEPDFLSGVCIQGWLKDDGMDSFIPQTATSRLHGLAQGLQRSKRLAIKSDPSVVPPNRLAQCAVLKSTLYSGKMKQVVQLLNGFGFLPKVTIYQNVKSDLELDKNTSVSAHDIKVIEEGLQIPYRFDFEKTHGICRGSDGRHWLVEISRLNGVLAMPLPLFETTRSLRFRDKATQLGDVGALRVLDDFGGFPSGEAFPAGRLVDSAIRSGYLLRLLNPDALRVFYDHTSYSSSMGWAFNERGDEAHNTAWRYGEDGYQRGVHYAISLSINAASQVAANLPQQVDALLDLVKRARRSIGRAFANILEKKAKRLTADQAKELLSIGQISEVIDALDALILPPIALAKANISLVSEGYIWWPTKKSPQIKFPEPLVGHLISHDMRPRFTLPSVDCDTTMHVFFKGDELKWCKFFHRGNQNVPPIYEVDEEQCRFIGRWETRQEIDRAIPSMFYSNDFDEREEVGEYRYHAIETGRDLGYTQVAITDFSDPIYMSKLFRVKSFFKTFSTRAESGRKKKSSITVPFDCREAYYYAQVDLSGSIDELYYEGIERLRDPHHYLTFRSFSIWLNHPEGCGVSPRRRVWIKVYEPYACSDVADSGPWAEVCDDAERYTYDVAAPPIAPAVATDRSAVGKLVVHFVCNSDHTPRIASVKESENDTDPGAIWFLPSPNPDSGDVHFISAVHNTYGDGDALKFMNEINKPDVTIAGFPNYPEYVKANVSFLGVVDGL